MESKQGEEKRFKGIAASPGIAHARVFLLAQKELTIPKFKVSSDQKPREVRRFEEALLETRKQIQAIRDEIKESLGEEEARIFDAHLLVLEDRALIDESIHEMEETGENIETALWEVGHRYIAAFGQIEDEYFRERAADIRDVLRRILSNLTGQKLDQLESLPDGAILVARDLVPSDSASIDKSNLRGIVIDAGGKTSHAVIVARSMNLPAVVGMGDFSQRINHNDIILVDGYEGTVILNPSEDTLFKYGKLKSERRDIEKLMIEHAQEASVTLDGHPVKLMGNIEGPDEAEKALEFGADGIGLFRTEYLFLNVRRLPTEDQQFQAYKQVAETMDDKPVIIRTLDLGGDKVLSAANMPLIKEANPFLGYRAVRFCLEHEHLFRAQLRAVLRASVYGDIRIMYPMISGAGELRKCNHFLDSCKEELRKEGIAFNEEIKSGSMIEIPSAAIAADTLVKDSDFFSVGTNDLIQYLIAVDRLNDRVAHLYEPTHPAVIRVLDTIIRAAKMGKIGVSICGEVAGDPVMVPLLIGLGINSLSMSPTLLPNVKYVVQNMELSEARDLAQMAISENDGSKILENLLEFYTSRTAKLY